MNRELELRQNLVGEGFLNAPAKLKGNRVTILGSKNTCLFVSFFQSCSGEIVSATGFEEKSLYIFSQILISRGWEFEDELEYYIADPDLIHHTQINKRYSK